MTGSHFSYPTLPVFFGFFCCYAATQLALQVQQERTHVVCSNREPSARPEGTPAMNLELELGKGPCQHKSVNWKQKVSELQGQFCSISNLQHIGQNHPSNEEDFRKKLVAPEQIKSEFGIAQQFPCRKCPKSALTKISVFSTF